MDERIMQFRVGVVVLAVALIAGFLTILFGHFKTFGGTSYSVYFEFPQAPGIAPETPIRKSGILIGRVTKVELFGPQQDRVRITASIDKDYKILRTDGVRITVSLLGDSAIEVVSGMNAPPDTPLEPGETIKGSVTTDPFKALANLEPEMTKAARSLSKAGDQVEKLAADIDRIVGPNNDQFERLLKKTESSLDQLQKTMSNFDMIIGDRATNEKFRQAISEFPTTLKQTEDAIASIQKTSMVAQRNMENLEGFTKPLGERGEGLINSADRSIRRLDELLGQMQQFSRQLNSREGSLGQLMYNPQLYQNLSEAATNINEISRQVKPILNDARAFSDKIARHPELLGVHGALQQSTGIK
jgi:phospholipid/cholesterol/gamma-HCH transport system substrate-binding protein